MTCSGLEDAGELEESRERAHSCSREAETSNLAQAAAVLDSASSFASDVAAAIENEAAMTLDGERLSIAPLQVFLASTFDVVGAVAG